MGEEDFVSDVPPWILGEYLLLEAMCHRAIEDLRDRSKREDAVDWLTDDEADESDVMSFKWVVNHLGLEWGVVRRYVERVIVATEGMDIRSV